VAYDSWGQARVGDNWLDPLAPETLEDLGLGFTGHPARHDADLVGMGGRSYQPRLGRFFSADPMVVSPLDAQAYNRYAYVLNRPLLFNDPTRHRPLRNPGAEIPRTTIRTPFAPGSPIRLVIRVPRHLVDDQATGPSGP